MKKPLKETLETILPKTTFKRGGKLYQVVETFFDKNSRHKRPIQVSRVIDHTPNSKYSGAQLRKIRAERGVGRPPKKGV